MKYNLFLGDNIKDGKSGGEISASFDPNISTLKATQRTSHGNLFMKFLFL